VDDSEQAEIERLIKAMRDLVEESRRLAKRHEEITQEYERLRQALEQAQSRRFGKMN
jgi:prefoldin subunit 5